MGAVAGIFFIAGNCLGQASFSSQSIADAFVTTGAAGGLSSSNFGAAGSLAIAASGLPHGEFQSMLKFDFAGAENSFNAQFGAGQWMIQSVTLQLTSSPHNNPIFNNIAASQFNVSLMQNNSWVEGTGTGGVPTSDGACPLIVCWAFTSTTPPIKRSELLIFLAAASDKTPTHSGCRRD